MSFDDYIDLILDPERIELSEGEPSYFLYSIGGRIVGMPNPESGRWRLLGRFRLFYVDAEAAVEAGRSLSDVFDFRQETVDYFTSVYDPETFEFSAQILKLFSWDLPMSLNLLVLDRLEILPKHRSNGLGLRVLRRLMERFGLGAGIAAMKPFPLQFEPKREVNSWDVRLGLTSFPRNSRAATAKLRSYYGLLGFKMMRGTPFMFRSLGEPLLTDDEILELVDTRLREAQLCVSSAPPK